MYTCILSVTGLYASILKFSKYYCIGQLILVLFFPPLFFSLSTLFLRPSHAVGCTSLLLTGVHPLHVTKLLSICDWHIGCLPLSATPSNVWHPWESSSQTSSHRQGNWAKAPAAVLWNPALCFTWGHVSHGLLPASDKCSRDTKTGPFLGDMGFLSQLILAWRLPAGLKEPSLVCTAV